jgi:glyoxylase-like metal-dependent hydrolase (beta-lactamase superfamily II)
MMYQTDMYEGMLAETVTMCGDGNTLINEYEIVGVPDGYIFDLGGGHEIELVFLPGHTCGHAGFLDKKNRIFFCGDDACFGAVGIGGSRRIIRMQNTRLLRGFTTN